MDILIINSGMGNAVRKSGYGYLSCLFRILNGVK